MRRASLLLVTALCCLAAPAPAVALGKVEGENASFEATGNVRLLAGYLHYPEMSPLAVDDGLAAGVGRLIFKGDLARDLSFDLHAYLDLSRGPQGGLGGALSTVGSFRSPYRTPYLAWAFWQRGSVQGQMGIDRMSLHARVGPIDLTAGRFPVNDSVTRVFTPNDFFAPFSATAINKAYKPGVDAVRAGFSLGELSALEITGVLGNDAGGSPSWSESAVLARVNTVLWGLDAALIGGKLAERWVAGGTVQGDLGPIGIRGEGHAGFADRNGDGKLDAPEGDPRRIYGRLSAGAGYRATWHNLSLDAEYAWYSDGAGDPADYLRRARRFFPDDLPLLGQHYVGVSVGGEIVPILHAGVLAMVSATDGSGVAVASLNYDVADEAALSVGMMIPWGRQPTIDEVTGAITLGSELGLLPLTLFLETRIFF